jgi:hypothetical protein
VEVAPFVSLVDRVLGVGDRVCLVDLCGSVPCEQRCQRIIDQFGVRRACSGSSSVCEQVGVNGRADPSSCHAMIMPLMWHDLKSARIVNEMSKRTSTAPRSLEFAHADQNMQTHKARDPSGVGALTAPELPLGSTSVAGIEVVKHGDEADANAIGVGGPLCEVLQDRLHSFHQFLDVC